MKRPPDISHKEYFINMLDSDHEYALELYKNVLTEGSEQEVELLIRALAQANTTNKTKNMRNRNLDKKSNY